MYGVAKQVRQLLLLSAVVMASSHSGCMSRTRPENLRLVESSDTNQSSPNRHAVAESTSAQTPMLPTFSSPPSDFEITRVTLFQEPLLPVGRKSSSHAEETSALAQAIVTYLKSADLENLQPFTDFLEKYSNSAWRVSTLVNLGLLHRRGAYFTKALKAFDEAWRLAKGEEDAKAHALADLAAGELADLSGRLGHEDAVQVLLNELEGRDVSGPASQKLASARQALWAMRNKQAEAFRCGAMAVARLQASLRPSGALGDPAVLRSRGARRGMSLTQVAHFAKQRGMLLRMVERSPGAEVPVPSIIHWRAGHFAALLKSVDDKNGQTRYLLEDPTFGGELWVSLKALNDETSGFFLVPGTIERAGWRAASAKQGRRIWGAGYTDHPDPEPLPPHNPLPKCGGGGAGGGGGPFPGDGQGMPRYDFNSMLISLNIVDTPVGYTPPRGPPVRFTITYNQKDIFQPAVFTYSNLGPKWTFNWISYITDNPSAAPGAQNLTVYERGGGQQTAFGSTYDPATGTYGPHIRSRAVVARTSDVSYSVSGNSGS